MTSIFNMLTNENCRRKKKKKSYHYCGACHGPSRCILGHFEADDANGRPVKMCELVSRCSSMPFLHKQSWQSRTFKVMSQVGMFPSRTRAQHTKSAHNPPPIIVIRHGAWRGVHSSISESSKHPLLLLVGKLATHTQFSTQNRMAPKPNVRFMLSQ